MRVSLSIDKCFNTKFIIDIKKKVKKSNFFT